MTKKVKIIIGVASLVGVSTLYYFLIFRKRKPNFEILNYDWDKRYIDVKFGKTENRLTEFNGITFTAGKSYDEKLYSVTSKPLGKGKVAITIFKNGSPVEEKEIDFDGRLVIDK